jgi:hypothetical protein
MGHIFNTVEIILRSRRARYSMQWRLSSVQEGPDIQYSEDYLPFKKGQIFNAVEIILCTRSPKYSMQWRSLQWKLSPAQEASKYLAVGIMPRTGEIHCSGDNLMYKRTNYSLQCGLPACKGTQIITAVGNMYTSQ